MHCISSSFLWIVLIFISSLKGQDCEDLPIGLCVGPSCSTKCDEAPDCEDLTSTQCLASARCAWDISEGECAKKGELCEDLGLAACNSNDYCSWDISEGECEKIEWPECEDLSVITGACAADARCVVSGLKCKERAEQCEDLTSTQCADSAWSDYCTLKCDEAEEVEVADVDCEDLAIALCVGPSCSTKCDEAPDCEDLTYALCGTDVRCYWDSSEGECAKMEEKCEDLGVADCVANNQYCIWKDGECEKIECEDVSDTVLCSLVDRCVVYDGECVERAERCEDMTSALCYSDYCALKCDEAEGSSSFLAQVAGALLDASNDGNSNGNTEEIQIKLSDATLMNLWAMIVVFIAINLAFCCFMKYKRGKDKKGQASFNDAVEA